MILVQETSAEDASAMIPHIAKGWGQQESKPHSVQRPEGRRTAYLCRCDYPWHRPELSCRLAAHEPDARGGCGLPPVLSTLAHGDFPRSMCKRSKLLVCQLRSHASRAPSSSEKRGRYKNNDCVLNPQHSVTHATQPAYTSFRKCLQCTNDPRNPCTKPLCPPRVGATGE